MSAPARTGFEARLREVRERIARAAGRSGRSEEAITLIAVTKTHPPEAVLEALAAGVTSFGENRVQEGFAKASAVNAALGAGHAAHRRPPSWHLIGHLQTNKVRVALSTFAILHSVDSERLLRAISAATTTSVQVMIEVNVAAEPQKYGIAPAELPALLGAAREFENIDIRGLMTVAPHTVRAEETRPVFRALRALAEGHNLPGLSMGMTNDYEVAIEEGATHVRIGRALFGDRE